MRIVVRQVKVARGNAWVLWKVEADGHPWRSRIFSYQHQAILYRRRLMKEFPSATPVTELLP